MQALSAALESASLQRSRAGARHILASPPVSALAHDARMLAVASLWLGGPAIPFKATLFDKSLDANWLVAWHQDTALPMASRTDAVGWGPWSEKYGIAYAHAPARVLERIVALRVHLDDSSAENGPLRVLPATHTHGVLSDQQVSGYAQQVAAVECRVAAGGIVVMRPLLIHASSKIAAPMPRRVLHIEYATTLEPQQGLHLRVA